MGKISCQSYVDEQLVGSGKLSQGAIIGSNGKIWAVIESLKIKETDCELLEHLFNNKSKLCDSNKTIIPYITIADRKYSVIKAYERTKTKYDVVDDEDIISRLKYEYDKLGSIAIYAKNCNNGIVIVQTY